MAILQAARVFGLSNGILTIILIDTDDTYATVTTPGYLTDAVQNNSIIITGSTMALVNLSNGITFLMVSVTGTAPNLVYSLVPPITS